MAFRNEGAVISFPAGGSISKYEVVKFNTDDFTVAQCDATSMPVGVAMDDASSGESVAVQISGIAMVTCAGTPSPGDWVISNTDGHVTITNTAATEDNICVGKAIETGADDDVISVILTPGIVIKGGVV